MEQSKRTISSFFLCLFPGIGEKGKASELKKNNCFIYPKNREGNTPKKNNPQKHPENNRKK